MRLFSRALWLTAFCVAVSCLPASAAGLTVTGLDHTGFMLSDGKTKILIDAVTEPSTQWPYKTPPAGVLGKIEKGESPFDGVTLLLITHDHEDHYSPAATIAFLKGNPKAVVVTTPEVEARLKTLPDFADVAARIVAPQLAWKQALTTTINGVALEIDRLKHGDDKKWACELDAFVITLGGKKVLYATATAGYFPEEYSELGYAGRGFDIAFLNYYMTVNAAKADKPASLNADGIAKIKTLIAPKTVVLMHITPPVMPSVEAMMPELQKELPGVTVFSELESRRY